jgi:sec-independent protein translocase protein TatC
MKFPKSQNPTAEMPFLDHLEELRWRILWSLLALIVLATASFFAVIQFDVIGLLKQPIDPYLVERGGKLIFLGVTEPFFVSLKLAVTLGIVLASPIIFYQVWAFLSPALSKRERRAIIPALYLGVLLFLAGAALAYFVALPFTLQFMLTFQAESLEPQITALLYFSFVTKLLLGFGVMFEMPVVTLVLTAIGVTSSKFLASKRRYAVAGMAILSSMITPGDAITATLILMGPLLLLYEFSILLAKLVEKGRRKSLEQEALESGAIDA